MTKTVTCLDSKNYRLTIGKKYDVLEVLHDGKTFIVKNDYDVLCKYSATLFETEPTDEDLVNNLIKTANIYFKERNRGGYGLDYYIFETSQGQLSFYSNNISCSVYDVSGLEGLIKSIVKSVLVQLPPDKKELAKQAYEPIVNNIDFTSLIKYSKHVAFYFLSTHYDKTHNYVEDENHQIVRKALMSKLHSISTARHENIEDVVRRTPNYSHQNLITFLIPVPINK